MLGKLVAGSALVLFWSLGAIVAYARQPGIAVGPNVQVSAANANLVHRETLIAADPVNRADLIACSVVLPATRNGVRTVVYRSSDGGSTWVQSLKVGDSNYNSNDPTCVVGKGRAYFGGFTYAWVQGLPTSFPQGGFVYVSRDDGRIWSRPATVGTGDRPFLAVDSSAESPYFGRVYVDSNYPVIDPRTHALVENLGVFTSRDGGRSFRGPTLVPTRTGRGEVFDGNCATTSKGVLACVFLSPKRSRGPSDVAIAATDKSIGNASLEAAVSTDGGATFARPTIISDAWMLFPSGAEISVIPYIAVDAGSPAFKDRLYVVWTDVRSGRSQVLLAWSADRGKTWTKPIIVDDDTRGDDSQPSIAVNNGGVVGIAWFDRRNNPNGIGWAVRFTASLDGGTSVLSSVAVSTTPETASSNRPLRLETDEPLEFRASRDPHKAPAVGGTAYQGDFGGGDTAGLSADADGVFHSVWIDNRTGLDQVWTAAISVRPEADSPASSRLAAAHAETLRPMRPGAKTWAAPLDPLPLSATTSGRQEVTNDLDLSLESGLYDPRSNDVSVDAVLTNISKHSVATPVLLLLTSVSSGVGRPSIASSAVEFDAQAGISHLGPGQSTRTRRIVVHLKDVRPLAARRGLDYVLSLEYLSLEGRVFAK